MHQGPAGHLPPKGAGLVPAYADTWRRGLGRRTPPCGKHPRGQRCTSTAAGTADRWPEGLQADTAGRLDLSAAVEAGPDAASTPAATSAQAAGGNCATPGHKMRPEGHQPPASSRAQLDTSTRGALPLRIWANGHTSACAPVPAPAPAQDLPGRTGPARPAGHLNAWADPAAIVSAAASQRHPWTRGAGPLPDTSTPTAGGARKKHQTRRNGA